MSSLNSQHSQSWPGLVPVLGLFPPGCAAAFLGIFLGSPKAPSSISPGVSPSFSLSFFLPFLPISLSVSLPFFLSNTRDYIFTKIPTVIPSSSQHCWTPYLCARVWPRPHAVVLLALIIPLSSPIYPSWLPPPISLSLSVDSAASKKLTRKHSWSWQCRTIKKPTLLPPHPRLCRRTSTIINSIPSK